MNNNKPQLIKTWRITQWETADVQWLIEQKLNYHLNNNTESIEVNGYRMPLYMHKSSDLVAETRTSKEEMLFRLKFEPNLVLLMQEYGMPYSMSACTLDRINW